MKSMPSLIINKPDMPLSPFMEIDNPTLNKTLKLTADKPISYLVHAHDVGQPTDYSADFVWHSLKKEKSFNVPDRGKLGVINFDSGISYFLGFGLNREDWIWKIASSTRMHLINLLVEEFSLRELTCEVCFVPYDSSTLLTILRVKNCGAVLQDLRIAGIISKEMVWDGAPPQRFSPTFTSTGKLVWGRYDEQHNTAFSCYEEWDKKRVRGNLLFSLGSDMTCEGHFQYNGMEGSIQIKPGKEEEVRFSINLRRFASEEVPNPWAVPLFSVEDEETSKNKSIKRNEDALSADWETILKQSIERYKTMPLIELPQENWISDFYASLELTRGNTFSPYKKMKHPFTNFCRVYSHNPYDWWYEGEGGTFGRTTFGTVLYAPELLKGHIRNVLDCQDESGRLPFCVNQNGVHDITSERSDMEKIPDFHEIWKAFTATPEVVWQIWNVYLWTGDRDFLEYGYAAGRRNHEWWLKNRDRDGDGLCCWGGVIETMRDNMPPIPTWRAISFQQQEALDLNCYLLVQERCLSEMADELGKSKEAENYRKMAERRIALMNKYMWDEEDKCYYGIDELNKEKKAGVRDISTLLPLWSHLATVDRARYLIDLYKNEHEFKTSFPVPTLAMSSEEFNPGEGWYGATWTWFNWLVILGLKEYGYYNMAAELGYKTIKLEFDSLEQTSHFREYYNSQTGEGRGLYDYEWSILPAAIIVQILAGIEPKADGLEILPCLPENWTRLGLNNLYIRKGKIKVVVERNNEITQSRVEVNGRDYPVFKDHGVKIPWDKMDTEMDIKIIL